MTTDAPISEATGEATGEANSEATSPTSHREDFLQASLQGIRALDDLRGVIAALTAVQTAARADVGQVVAGFDGPIMEGVRGRDAVEKCRADVIASATDTVRVAESRAHAEHVQADAPNVHRLYPREFAVDTDWFWTAQGAEMDGGKSRLVKAVPAPMVLADEACGIIEVRPDYAVFLFPSPFLSVMLAYFGTAWQSAIPLGNLNSANEWRLSDADQALLRLLWAGLKDQAIARHLGIGLRTVVRRIGNLGKALDADTRFQMGANAQARGLLGADGGSKT